jgi:hypothetical protein
MNSNDAKLPLCLQETDKAGKIRSRTSKTENAYRIRYLGLARALAKQLGDPHVEIGQVIDSLCHRAPALAKRSYYLYCACIKQELRDIYVDGDLTVAAVEDLVARLKPEAGAAVGSKRKTGSSRKRRHFRPVTHGTMVSILGQRKGNTAQNLACMLEVGPEIGVRPCEFFGCRLEGKTLYVRSAKFSAENERGIAAWRQFELLEFGKEELAELADLIERLNEELRSVEGDREKLVRRYSAMMRRTRCLVASASDLTLGATRHQFRANLARAGYRREEIAAAMGHASAGTAEAHYGRSTKGWYPIDSYRPVSVPANMVALVRPGARAKFREAAYEPIKFHP